MTSLLPKGGPAIAMGSAITMALSAIVYSHYQQKRDKAVMRAGVNRDKERLKAGRKQRKKEQQQQQGQQQLQEQQQQKDI